MQEIIVYRNPAEAAFWHAMSSGDGVMIFMAVIGLGVLWAFTYSFCDKIFMRTSLSRNTRHSHSIKIASVLVLFVTIALHYWHVYG